MAPIALRLAVQHVANLKHGVGDVGRRPRRSDDEQPCRRCDVRARRRSSRRRRACERRRIDALVVARAEEHHQRRRRAGPPSGVRSPKTLPWLPRTPYPAPPSAATSGVTWKPCRASGLPGAGGPALRTLPALVAAGGVRVTDHGDAARHACPGSSAHRCRRAVPDAPTSRAHATTNTARRPTATSTADGPPPAYYRSGRTVARRAVESTAYGVRPNTIHRSRHDRRVTSRGPIRRSAPPCRCRAPGSPVTRAMPP